MVRSFMSRRVQVACAKECSAVQHVFLEAFEIEIDHWSDIKGYELRNHQTAHHHHAQRPTRGTIRSHANCDRHRPKHSSQRCHQDGTKAVHASVMNCNVSSLTRIYTLTCKVD